tara:strand:- start:45 stop:557 length:513 start_codon:yes stop_codon:yes gene_type:complete
MERFKRGNFYDYDYENFFRKEVLARKEKRSRKRKMINSIDSSLMLDIAGKYEEKVNAMRVRFNIHPKSNFSHVTRNRLNPIIFNPQLIAEGIEGDDLRGRFSRALVCLKKYLNWLDRSEEFRNAEMGHEDERYCPDIDPAMTSEELANVGYRNGIDYYLDVAVEKLKGEK